MKHPAWKHHWPHIVFVCAMVSLHILTSFLGDNARFAMLPFHEIQHQWWRLFSGHLVHANLQHLLMNIGAFAIISTSFWQENRWYETLIVLTILMLGTSLSLGLASNIAYVGFSGVLHGYLAYLLIRHFFSQPWIHSLFLGAVMIKIISEQLGLADTASTAALIGIPVAIDAHFYGAMLGTGIGLIALLRRNHT